MPDYIKSKMGSERGYNQIHRMAAWPYDGVWWKKLIRYAMIAIAVYLGWPGVKSIVIGLWIRIPWHWFVTRCWGPYSFSKTWVLFKEIMTEYYTSGPAYWLLSHLGHLQGVVTFAVKWICFWKLYLFLNVYLFVNEKTMQIKPIVYKDCS